MPDENNGPDSPPVVNSSVIGAARTGQGARGKRVNLVKLAETQRQLLWCILARIGVELGGFMIGQALPPPLGLIVYGLVSLVLIVVTILFIVRMAAAYGTHPALAILGGLAIVIPCAGLILLLLLNQRVTTTLQRAGAKVGLMGVNAAEMVKLRQGFCAGCGYELRGLVRPVCPECGAAVGAGA